MAFLQRVGDHAESALPRAVQQVQGALDSFPVRQVEEGVRHRFRIAALQDVLRWQAERLHFQQVLHPSNIEQTKKNRLNRLNLVNGVILID